MPSADRDRVRRLQNREPGGFDEIFVEYGDRIYRFCYRLCGHTADAEDLTQDVFVAAYQGLARFEGRSSVATWLYRIALYRWGRIHGGRRPETVPLDEEMVGAGYPLGATPDLASAGVERLSMENALLALPDGLREAFLLVKAEGLKYREAAQALGVPQGTVQSRVHDAVVKLRALLAEDGGEQSTCGDPCPGAGGTPDPTVQSAPFYRREARPPNAKADL
jgi:RNA polymerase sigma-70 factor (ECF subfamily)